MNAIAIVYKLLEDGGVDPDSPEFNLDRYAQAIGLDRARDEADILQRFKAGVVAYIRWAVPGEYNPQDLRRISRAVSFEQVEQILQRYETDPSFLEMVSQGFFV